MNKGFKFLLGTTLIVSGCASVEDDDYLFSEIDHQETQYVKSEKDDYLGATINDNMSLYQSSIDKNNADANDAKLAGVFEDENKKAPIRKDVMGEYGRQLASLRRGLNAPANVKTDDSIKRKEVEEVRGLEVAKPGTLENLAEKNEENGGSLFGKSDDLVEIPAIKNEETNEVEEAKLQREKELDKRPLTDKERRRAVIKKIEDTEEMDAIRASDKDLPSDMKILDEQVSDNITIKEKMTPEEERKFLDNIVSGGKKNNEEIANKNVDVEELDGREAKINSSTPIIENEYDMRSFTSELTAEELDEIARISSHVGEADFKVKEDTEKLENKKLEAKHINFSEPKNEIKFMNNPIVEQLPKREEVKLKPAFKLKKINKLKRPSLKLKPRDSEINFDVLEEE